MVTSTTTTPVARIGLSGIRELLRYNLWANDRLLQTCAALSDAQLDQRFEMGMGTLRETLNHIAAAERVWLDRWVDFPTPRFRGAANGMAISALTNDFHEIAAERDAWLNTLVPTDLERVIVYRNTKGIEFRNWVGGLVLHVCNHGVYHRAQAVNMLRHVGASLGKPEIDYIFMRVTIGNEPPPNIDVATARTFCAYADWATDRMLAVAAKLTDAQLDRPFEIGVGTLRQTLLHIRFAEQWWLENWTKGPIGEFPETPDSTSIAELIKLTEQTRKGRNAVLAGATDADMARPIEVHPRPGIVRRFLMGVTLLQICCHGTHHRAQAMNMLRHLGSELPTIDVVMKLREES